MKTKIKVWCVIAAVLVGVVVVNRVVREKNGEFEFQMQNTTLTEYNGSDADVVIPDQVTKIARGTFSNQQGDKSGIETITVPASVKEVDSMAFAYCTAKEISISEGTQTIGSYAFYGSGDLKTVYLPESITTIPEEGLFDEENQKQVTIVTPEGSAAETYAKENGITIRYPESN